MMEDLDVATGVVWVLRIALPLVLFCLCFGVPKSLKPPQWLNEIIWRKHHVYSRARLLKLRRLCKEPPDALASMKTVDEATAPSLFQESKKREKDREEREQRHKERKKNKEEHAQQKEVAKAQEEQMHLESLVNYVAFNRKEQQRTFHIEGGFVPPPPPGRPPPNASKPSQVAVPSAAGDRANKEVQMVLRGAMKLGRVDLAKDLYDKLRSLQVDVAPATFTLMVEACIQAEDLQSASDFLMKMEAAGHALDNALLDKVMDLYTVHKRKRELRKVIETVSDVADKEQGNDNKDAILQPELQQVLHDVQQQSELKRLEQLVPDEHQQETQMPFIAPVPLLTPEEVSAAAAALVEEPSVIPVQGRRLPKHEDQAQEFLAPLQLPGQPWVPAEDGSGAFGSAVAAPQQQPRLSADAAEFMPTGHATHAAMPGFIGNNSVWDASGATTIETVPKPPLPPGNWVAGQPPANSWIACSTGKEEKVLKGAAAFFVPEEFRDPDKSPPEPELIQDEGMAEPIKNSSASPSGGMSANAVVFVPTSSQISANDAAGASWPAAKMSADAPEFMPTSEPLSVAASSPPRLNAGAMSFVPQDLVTYDASHCTWTIDGQMMPDGCYQEMQPMPPPPPPPSSPPPRAQNKGNQRHAHGTGQGVPKGVSKSSMRPPKARPMNGAPQPQSAYATATPPARSQPDRPPPTPKAPLNQHERPRYRQVESQPTAASSSANLPDREAQDGSVESRRPKAAGNRMGRNGPRTHITAGNGAMSQGAASVVIDAALAAAKDTASSAAVNAETQRGAGASSTNTISRGRGRGAAKPQWTKKAVD